MKCVLTNGFEMVHIPGSSLPVRSSSRARHSISQACQLILFLLFLFVPHQNEFIFFFSILHKERWVLEMCSYSKMGLIGQLT